MYIEFTLPQAARTLPAAYALNTELAAWAQKYKIEYKTKIIKCKMRVAFDSDDGYTLFGLTWTMDSKYPGWTNYRMISDLNNKT
jgi:hypothetical protein